MDSKIEIGIGTKEVCRMRTKKLDKVASMSNDSESAETRASVLLEALAISQCAQTAVIADAEHQIGELITQRDYFQKKAGHLDQIITLVRELNFQHEDDRIELVNFCSAISRQYEED